MPRSQMWFNWHRLGSSNRARAQVHLHVQIAKGKLFLKELQERGKKMDLRKGLIRGQVAKNYLGQQGGLGIDMKWWDLSHMNDREKNLHVILKKAGWKRLMPEPVDQQIEQLSYDILQFPGSMGSPALWMGAMVFRVKALGNPQKTASSNNFAKMAARVLIPQAMNLLHKPFGVNMLMIVL